MPLLWPVIVRAARRVVAAEVEGKLKMPPLQIMLAVGGPWAMAVPLTPPVMAVAAAQAAAVAASAATLKAPPLHSLVAVGVPGTMEVPVQLLVMEVAAQAAAVAKEKAKQRVVAAKVAAIPMVPQLWSVVMGAAPRTIAAP